MCENYRLFSIGNVASVVLRSNLLWNSQLLLNVLIVLRFKEYQSNLQPQYSTITINIEYFIQWFDSTFHGVYILSYRIDSDNFAQIFITKIPLHIIYNKYNLHN